MCIAALVDIICRGAKLQAARHPAAALFKVFGCSHRHEIDHLAALVVGKNIPVTRGNLLHSIAASVDRNLCAVDVEALPACVGGGDEHIAVGIAIAREIVVAVLHVVRVAAEPCGSRGKVVGGVAAKHPSIQVLDQRTISNLIDNGIFGKALGGKRA